MKKKLRNLIAGAAALLSFSGGQQADASHFQGSEMTYLCIAPGIYRVNMKLYRDCTGATSPTTAVLNLKSTGCNNGRNVNMTRIGQSRIGDPYCPSVPKLCNSTSANYEEVVLTATVTFTQAEQACPNWILSWSECCRPATANLQGSGTMYVESYINLGTPTSPINNSSPEFGPFDVVVPYVNAYVPVTVSTYALDPEQDSLVYSLVTPLDMPNLPVPYTNYGAVLINHPSMNPNLAAVAPAGTFSATFPIHSFKVDYTQSNPVAVSYFDLDAQNGSLSFTPTAYFPGSTPVQGLNKYVVVVKIDEYRKINGQPVKIGTIRRDMLITIKEPCPNTYPSVATPLANNQPITPSTIINLRPGTPLNFKVTAADSNSTDVVEMQSDASILLPGASFVVTPGNRPIGTLSWTPTASDVRSQIYYFRVTVKDNACPLKGVQMQTFGVRVSATGGVTGTSDDLNKDQSFVAFPNPFSESVSFKMHVTNPGVQEIIIYNVMGRQIDKISLQGVIAGEQQFNWKNAGKHAAGTYIAKLVAGNKTVQTIKLTKQQ